MNPISDIKAREILDSRGQPTVEAEVWLKNGRHGRAAVPSGASTGSGEACERRDQDPARYGGRGVLNAVQAVREIIRPALLGQAIDDQQALDDKMIALDGSADKSRLGANAILAVSLASARAAAAAAEQPLYRRLQQQQALTLPMPLMNILNGGAHADNRLDVQEFMILPIGAPNFPEALRYGAEIFATLKGLLKAQGRVTAVGDEGGFAPDLGSNEAALGLLVEAISKSGLNPGSDVVIGMDIAASELYHEGKYHLKAENKHFSAAEFAALLSAWCKSYPITTIEDPMDENDWQGWQIVTEALGQTVQIVGDDLFVTDATRLRRGIAEKAANAILIKPNQIGSLSETLHTIATAQKAGFGCVISHRSGETEDPFIADLAVATAAGQIKTGSLCRSERVAKYNRLLRIHESLGQDAQLAGWSHHR